MKFNYLKIFLSKKKRIRPLLQSETTECGLVCLVMIANHLGHNYTVFGLRKEFRISSRGISLDTLVEYAGKLNLETEAYRLEMEDLVQLKLPAILHWDLNHFVVLKKTGRKFSTILDPACGERKLTNKKLSKHFTGIALEIESKGKLESLITSQGLSYRWFFESYENLTTNSIFLFLISFSMLLLSLILPFYSMTVFDSVVSRKDMPLLNILSIIAIIVTFLYIASSWTRDRLILLIGAHFSSQLSKRTMSHLLSLPLDFFNRRHVGDLVSRLSSLTVVRKMITEDLISTLIDTLILLFTFSLMFYYASKLALTVLLFIGTYALVRFLFYESYKSAQREHVVSSSAEDTMLIESIRAMQTIKLHDGESLRMNGWKKHFNQSQLAMVRSQSINISSENLAKVIFSLENILVIYIGSISIMEGRISVGVFISFLSYKLLFEERFRALIDRFFEFRLLDLHVERLADILLQVPEKNSSRFEFSDMSGNLELKDVSFKYSEIEEPILKSINLTIKSGEKIAIVGKSGCGKSSLIRIMLGLNVPDTGDVSIDGVSIDENIKSYRKNIATVMQDDVLISGTILENISFFSESPDLDLAIDCAKKSQIFEDIQSMPMKFHTMVSSYGSGLSGGQRQRILLARALYRNPKILFLDEATSGLDVLSEKSVLTELFKMNSTVVIVAHRPETIRYADRVLKVENGEISELELFRESS